MRTRLYRPENVSENLVAGDYSLRFLALGDDLILVFAHPDGYFPARPENVPSLANIFGLEAEPFAHSEMILTPGPDGSPPPVSPAPQVAAAPKGESREIDALKAEIQKAMKDSDTPRLQELYLRLAAMRPAPQEITDESLVMLPPEALEAERQAEREMTRRITNA